MEKLNQNPFEKKLSIVNEDSEESKVSNPNDTLNDGFEQSATTNRNTLEKSIDIIFEFIEYGEQAVSAASNKELIVFLGSTGAGKSTIINYLNGCEMEKENRFIKVKKDSHIPALMTIGHSKNSETFIPEIACGAEGLVFGDFSGFNDNRGQEISISNAIIRKRVIMEAKSVKLVFLLNFHSLMDDRGVGEKNLKEVLTSLFGNWDTFLKNKQSCLIMITHIDQQNHNGFTDLDSILREKIGNKFPYDRFTTVSPMDNCLPGGMKRSEIPEFLKKMLPLTNGRELFNTILNPKDISFLLEINKEIGSRIKACFQSKDVISLSKEDFDLAANHLNKIHFLDAIEHEKIRMGLKSTTKQIKKIARELNSIFQDFYIEEKIDQMNKVVETMASMKNSFKNHNHQHILNILNFEKLNKWMKKKQEKKEKDLSNEIEFQKNLYKTFCNSYLFKEASDLLIKMQNNKEYSQYGLFVEEDLNILEKLKEENWNECLKRKKKDLSKDIEDFTTFCKSYLFEEASELFNKMQKNQEYKKNGLLAEQDFNFLRKFMEEKSNEQLERKKQDLLQDIEDKKNLFTNQKSLYKTFCNNYLFNEASELLIKMQNNQEYSQYGFSVEEDLIRLKEKKSNEQSKFRICKGIALIALILIIFILIIFIVTNNTTINKLENTNNDRQVTIKSLENTNNNMQVTIKNLENTNNNMQVTIKNLENTNFYRQVTIKNLENTNNNMQVTIKDLENTNNNMHVTIKNLENRIVYYDKEVDNLEKQIAEKSNQSLSIPALNFIEAEAILVILLVCIIAAI